MSGRRTWSTAVRCDLESLGTFADVVARESRPLWCFLVNHLLLSIRALIHRTRQGQPHDGHPGVTSTVIC